MKLMQKILPVLLLTFYLGIYGGKVAIFNGNSKKPMYVSSYSVETLPKDAQEALKKRIPVRSRKDLTRLMETYLS